MTTYAKPVDIKAQPREYTDDQKKKFSVDLKKQYEEEKKTVKGRFLCFEPIGGSVTFVYKKYKWDQPTEFTFIDGENYTIPLGVARHLNGIDITAKKLNGNLNTCSYPVHAYQTDKSGNTSVNIGKRVRRYAFQTTEGMSIA